MPPVLDLELAGASSSRCGVPGRAWALNLKGDSCPAIWWADLPSMAYGILALTSTLAVDTSAHWIDPTYPMGGIAYGCAH